MKHLLLRMIRWYQRCLSPQKLPSCRFVPTCSTYAVEAIERFGVFRGGLLAVYRLLRCQPLGKWGYDPVPERFTFRRVNAVPAAVPYRGHRDGEPSHERAD